MKDPKEMGEGMGIIFQSKGSYAIFPLTIFADFGIWVGDKSP